MFTLGKLIAADIFLNNADRIPSHSFKQGNAGNLIFEVFVNESLDDKAMKEGGEGGEANVQFMAGVAGCDNKCYPVVGGSGEARARYIEMVEAFVKEVFADLDVIIKGERPLNEYEYPSMRHVVGFMKEQAQVEMKGREVFKVLEGLVVGMYNISNVGLRVYEESIY